MTCFLPMLLVLFSLTDAPANETALPKCPSGKFEAVLADSDEPGSGTLVFRLAGAGATVGAFDLGGYSRYARLLWSPDGRFAAVQTHYTRHTLELSVFEVTATGIKQAKLDDYTQNIYGRLNILHGGRGRADTPLKWLGDDRLLIEAAGTLDDEKDYRYNVEVRMLPGSDEVIGWLEKIEKAVDPAVDSAE